VIGLLDLGCSERILTQGIAERNSASIGERSERAVLYSQTTSRHINGQAIIGFHVCRFPSILIYEAMDRVTMPRLYAIAFITLFAVRYLRAFVHIIVFYFLLRSPKLPTDPVYRSSDVTVVVPSVLDSDIFETLESIARNKPHQILLVVTEDNVAVANELQRCLEYKGLVIVPVSQLGKRVQMVAGIKQVQTPVTVFSDDDVVCPPNYFSYLLAPFNDPRVGAAGTKQRVKRDPRPSVWNMLGIAYLERRNFNTITTNYIDGSVSTLSGRTAAYRTEILKRDNFFDFFINDQFLGKQIRTGDDKRLTMGVFSSGWRIRITYTEEAVLYTSLDEGVQFLHQCLRWARSHWQGNAAVVANESYWWRRHTWSAYAVYFSSLMTPAILVDGTLYYLLKQSLLGQPERFVWYAMTALVIFTLLQKTVKLWPHFFRHPSDLKFIPILLAFSYLHGFINIYALLTMTANRWGGRSTIADEVAHM